MRKGKFIVFEGIDGSGKSTQMRQLGKYLEERGEKCFYTHEPTESPFGELLRACMSGKIDADEHTIAALFAADRLDHVQNPVYGMRAMLEEGNVLCDRYYFSSFAYNGGVVPLDWVIELNRPAMELLRPDLVVFIDLDPEEGMRRISRRTERERYETIERQRLTRNKYLEVFEKFPENVAVIKSMPSREETQEEIRRVAMELFGGRA